MRYGTTVITKKGHPAYRKRTVPTFTNYYKLLTFNSMKNRHFLSGVKPNNSYADQLLQIRVAEYYPKQMV